MPTKTADITVSISQSNLFLKLEAVPGVVLGKSSEEDFLRITWRAFYEGPSSEENVRVIQVPGNPFFLFERDEYANWISTFGQSNIKQSILFFYLNLVPKGRPLVDGGRLYLLINAHVPGNFSREDMEYSSDGWEIFRGRWPPVPSIKRISRSSISE